jgi:hypothetical protein
MWWIRWNATRWLVWLALYIAPRCPTRELIISALNEVGGHIGAKTAKIPTRKHSIVVTLEIGQHKENRAVFIYGRDNAVGVILSSTNRDAVFLDLGPTLQNILQKNYDLDWVK